MKRKRPILWVAQGFGSGWAPGSPGTAGSLAGFPLVFLLLATGSLWAYLGGAALLTAASVWICGKAEDLLEETDPSSVVFDEMIAMPICFLGWVIGTWRETGMIPSWPAVWTWEFGFFALAVLVAFRVFDIWKPWPVRQLQGLPRGWGVTVDDVFAACYVNLAVWTFAWAGLWPFEPGAVGRP